MALLSPKKHNPIGGFMQKACPRCERLFVGRRNQIYCTSLCMKNAYNLRAGYGGALYEQTKGTVGAIHELSVSIDLFKRGYSVFRALSPHCKCDLVALKDGELKRIEVRTGVRTKAGKLCYPTKDATTYDILVVVERNTGVLNYFPELTKNPCPAEVNTNPRAISYESST